MLWLGFTTWDKQRLDIAMQGFSRAKWPPEANIAIGTDQDQSSLLGFIALVQFTCEVMQDRAFAGEDLEEGLWFCSLTCSYQSVGGAISSVQRSLVVALIDGDGTVRIGDADLREGFCQAMRGSRKRRKEDRGQRIA